jgi:RNA polymerase-interacting CarD/CdnL/TRCF family regulator
LLEQTENLLAEEIALVQKMAEDKATEQLRSVINFVPSLTNAQQQSYR